MKIVDNAAMQFKISPKELRSTSFSLLFDDYNNSLTCILHSAPHLKAPDGAWLIYVIACEDHLQADNKSIQYSINYYLLEEPVQDNNVYPNIQDIQHMGAILKRCVLIIVGLAGLQSKSSQWLSHCD